ncbi:gamma carbonic anhydrase family protein [Streptomyces sp. NPDC060065]|uniref:gamma carbonic anhydrase family protein n=1 Tax=Streptomyces sp. NPDC060065 TaxID=3347050 RepID=UPI00368760CF
MITLAGDRRPHVAGAWVAPTATVVGAVTLGDFSSVWYGGVLRRDGDAISVGAGSNVQDGSVVHADPGLPVSIGNGVSVGHRAVLHGCVVENDVLIGIGAVVLNGARVGAGALVAAGAVILEGTQVPPGSLVAGVPAKVRRATSDSERSAIRDNARRYVALVAEHISGEEMSPT